MVGGPISILAGYDPVPVKCGPKGADPQQEGCAFHVSHAARCAVSDSRPFCYSSDERFYIYAAFSNWPIANFKRSSDGHRSGRTMFFDTEIVHYAVNKTNTVTRNSILLSCLTVSPARLARMDHMLPQLTCAKVCNN